MPRARQFDEPDLLHHAQEAFWSRGYERTSVADISLMAGVGNGSIYAAYQSKLGLFLEVFNRYCNERVTLVRGIIGGHTGAFEDAIAQYLEAIVGECTSHRDRRGCLMLNSLAELGGRYPEVVAVARRSISAMEGSWGDRVRQFRTEGHINIADDEIGPLAAHVVLVSQGLIQLSRTGATPASLRRIASASSRMSAAAYAA